MESKKSELTAKDPTKWSNYKDLLINLDLLKKGLLVIKPSSLTADNRLATKNSFVLNDRELSIESTTQSHNYAKATLLAVKKAKQLLSKLQLNISDNIFVFNRKRREEIFLPLILDKDDHFACYVFPWINDSIKFEFNGFKTFITCGCLFGSSLTAIDNFQQEFTFITHQPLAPEQKIIALKYNTSTRIAYEEMLLLQLDRLCLIVTNFCTYDRPKLIYHLPHYDYCLYGISLFIKNKLSYHDLSTFIQLIFTKMITLTKEIKYICDSHEIEAMIQSPFDNLFGHLDITGNITDKLLQCLGLLSDHFNTPCSIQKEANTIEVQVVRTCLQKLRENTFDQAQKKIWSEFTEKNLPEINNFECLFKVANAVMLGIATLDNKAYEACSLLPLTEKQIQLHYNSIISKFFKAKNLETFNAKPIFNFTMIDTVISYSARNKGGLFYQDECQAALSELISDHKTLYCCYKNLSFYAQKEKVRKNTFKEDDSNEYLLKQYS